MLKKLLLIVIAISQLALLFAIINPNTVIAATIFQNKPGECADGGLAIKPPIKKDGNKYYCGKDFKEGELTPQPCAEGISIVDAGGFGQLCAATPDKYEYKTEKKELIPRKENADDSTCKHGASDGSDLCGLIENYIVPAIQFLTVGFGLIVTIMIVVGGIQYSASGGDPQAAANAKKRISNAIFALVAYAFLFALLQFLVPGGVF